MENKRAFTIKYHGATDSNGSRVSIYDNRFNKRKYIPFNYELTGIYNMANEYLKSAGIECDTMSETKDSYILTTDNFDIEL